MGAADPRGRRRGARPGETSEKAAAASSESQPVVREVAGFRVLRCTRAGHNEPEPHHVCYVRRHGGRAGDDRLPARRTAFLVSPPRDWSRQDLAAAVAAASEATVNAVHLSRLGGARARRRTVVHAGQRVDQALLTDDEDPFDLDAVQAEQASAIDDTKNQGADGDDVEGLDELVGAGVIVAHIVFAKPRGLDRLLEASTLTAPAPDEPLPTALEQWTASAIAARFLPRSLVAANADAHVIAWEHEQEAARAARLAQQVPDEEGWTTVVRKSRRTPESEEEGGSGDRKRRKRERAEKRMQGTLELYGHNKVAAQREALALLRRRFEEDKARIARMRAARKFKP